MAITYLMDKDPVAGPVYFAEARKYFEQEDPDGTIRDASNGAWTLDDVFKDLRADAKEGKVYPVINLVAHGTAFSALQFPMSEQRRKHDGGIITLDALKHAVNKKGSEGYPAVLGPPAVTASTKVCFYGCDVGRDAEFMSLLASLFGPDVTLYAPLRMAVFRHVGDKSVYRLARSWSTVYPRDVRTATNLATTRADLATKLKARFPKAAGDITAAIATATPELESTYLFSSRLDITFEDAGTPATADPPLKVTSAVLPGGTVDDTTVQLSLTAPDFTSVGNQTWTAWVAILGQVIEEQVSLENGAQYRKTVLSAPKQPAKAALVPEREPLPVPDVTEPEPDPEPSEDEMKYYGKHRGVVVEVMDAGRLKVEVPSLVGDSEVAGPLVAEACLPPVPRSLLTMPGIGAGVWVEFEGGDTNHPVWTGAMVAVNDPQELTLGALSKVMIKAPRLEVEATTTEMGEQVHTKGIVHCVQLRADSLVQSPAYTPGAGMIGNHTH